MVGQPFQEWYALTHTSQRLSESNLSGVDISIPNTIELHVGTVSLEHRPGSGVGRDDVPDIVVPSSPSPVDSQVLGLISGAEGQSRDGSSPCCQIPYC